MHSRGEMRGHKCMCNLSRREGDAFTALNEIRRFYGMRDSMGKRGRPEQVSSVSDFAWFFCSDLKCSHWLGRVAVVATQPSLAKSSRSLDCTLIAHWSGHGRKRSHLTAKRNVEFLGTPPNRALMAQDR